VKRWDGESFRSRILKIFLQWVVFLNTIFSPTSWPSSDFRPPLLRKVTDRRKLTNKLSLYGMFSFQFYRWNQYQVTPVQSREWVDGSWVMGQMGHENRMGHTGHGSLGVDPWPVSFLTLWLGLYIVAMIIISCQSVMHVQLCMRLTKFQVHVHIQVPASRASAGTRVTVGYPGSLL